MKKTWLIISITAITIFVTSPLKAQYLSSSDSAFNAGTPMTGRLWGLVFGDYYYKVHADALNRGGSNQYSGLPQGNNAFQTRRIWLGYDYNFNKNFATEILLAAEDNLPAGTPPSSGSVSGDQLLNNKLAFYIKLANLRIKNLWKGTDMVIGQQSAPAYGIASSTRAWNYRSIEKTIADIRRTPAYDFGLGLQGTFNPKIQNYGYHLLVANGNGAKPANNSYNWLYGEIWANFFNKKLTVDFYTDYYRLDWTDSWRHSRQMLKGFIGYNASSVTFGLEGFVNNLKEDVFATKNNGDIDTLNNVARGISAFVHGDIIKEKLRFFARYDHYTPTDKVNNSLYISYVLNTNNYTDDSYSSVATSSAPPVATGDKTYIQDFIILGLDFMPVNNIHIMPNIWYNRYSTQLSNDLNNTVNGALANKAKGDNDLVLRITFFYTFGK
jgi:hypothetical protein